MGIKSVITADIVNSTKLTAKKEKKLTQDLQSLLAIYKVEFYRGDSFQVYLHQPAESLRMALLCRTAAISISQENDAFPSDVRVSIGIGHIKKAVRTLAAAKEEVFILSGRAFDEMTKKGSRLAVTTYHPMANEGLEVIAEYINSIFRVMTPKQAAVIFELLKGQKQQVVARKLKRSKSTINQHVSSGRWPEIESLLEHFDNIINQLT